MVRASAKNHRHVLITTNPARYGDVIEALQSVDDPASVGMTLRQSLALEAFEHTAAYDVAIAQELHRRVVGDPADGASMEDQRDRLPQSVLESEPSRRHPSLRGKRTSSRCALRRTQCSRRPHHPRHCTR